MIKHFLLLFICRCYSLMIPVSINFDTSSIIMFQVVIQILDVDELTSGYGYLLMFEAIGTLMGGPVAGVIIIFVSQTMIQLLGCFHDWTITKSMAN